MTEYTVVWEIQIDAETPEEAALEAESIMRDYSTDGHRPVFAVFPTDAPDTKEEIDLENMGELLCAECGAPYFVTDNGVSHHEDADSPDGIDHDADGDHVAHEGER
jgi:hypothetical protein